MYSICSCNRVIFYSTFARIKTKSLFQFVSLIFRLRLIWGRRLISARAFRLFAKHVLTEFLRLAICLLLSSIADQDHELGLLPR